jgi:nicotinamidase-related amidase
MRDFERAIPPAEFSSEKDLKHVYHNKEIPLSQLALILIDVWADHPIKGWKERANTNIRTKLLPLVQAARAHGVLVVHCPNGEQIHDLVKPAAGEFVFNGPDQGDQLFKLLRPRKIKYLLYAGYASNMCILNRPTGIIQMSRRGFRSVLVRDASLAVEGPEFLDKELTHQVAVYMVETNWGFTTTVADVVAALA